jgi:hypothetical protein
MPAPHDTEENVSSEPPSRETRTQAGVIRPASGYVADALRYWEPRRVIYNVVLALVVGGHVIAGWPDVGKKLSINLILGFFFLAVLANVCYCAVYLVDLFVQFSGLHIAWAKGRVLLLAIGTAFAAVITHFFSTNMLGGGW